MTQQQRISKYLVIVLITIFVCWASPNNVSAQDSQSKMRFVEWMFVDWIDLISRVDTETFVLGGASMGLIGASSYLDESMQTQFSGFTNSAGSNYLLSTNRLGDPISLPAASVVFALSLLSDNHKFQNASFTSVESIIYAGVIWTSLKYVIGRQRPEEENGAYEFSFFNQDHNSFPSGHTGTAFALITPFVQYIDNPYAKLLYILPTSTALARQHLDKHWLSDTVAGGLVGYFVGSRLSRLHKDDSKTGQKRFGLSMIGQDLVPSLRIQF